ncbi:MAG: sigma-54-dependent transcriptional regulator [Planctomycetota bacterium]
MDRNEMGSDSLPAGVESASGLTTLAVSEDQSLREKLSSLLQPHSRQVITAEEAGEGLHWLADASPELIVIDLSNDTDRGLRVLSASKDMAPASKVLALVEDGDMDTAVAAIKAGAWNCIPKPLHPDQFLDSAKRAIEEVQEWIIHQANDTIPGYWSNGQVMVGQSEAMNGVWERIDMVRDVTSNVLIQGETGTGKELVAHAIHHRSPRADGPFVKLNCGAIPKDLLESELFGHEKGAFTGALQERRGRFEMADGGTLLLDEIGDMPLELQVKLLGVIQDRFVQRVGGHEKIPVDVRILAATHQDLQEAIEENNFREDLYYRLNVINIEIPPLRYRRDDIPLLVEHFINQYTKQTGRDVEGITPEALDMLKHFDYPGNVRQLENIVESSVVLCQGAKIETTDLPEELSGSPELGEEFMIRPGMSLQEVEKRCILQTLRFTSGNKTRAAELLGITPRSIHRKLKQYEIPGDAMAG